MFDKEMMDALRADAEKLGHLTGEDHTPEFLADCEACDGKGYISQGYALGEYPVPEPVAKLLRLCVKMKLVPEDVK